MPKSSAELGALMGGVSTREYDEVLPEMAETVGVSRSSVSRQAIEASAEQLKTLREKRWDTTEILVIYIDGQRFAAHHILSAVGSCRGRWRSATSLLYPETPAHRLRTFLSHWNNTRSSGRRGKKHHSVSSKEVPRKSSGLPTRRPSASVATGAVYKSYPPFSPGWFHARRLPSAKNATGVA
jgi:hypothetical protein